MQRPRLGNRSPAAAVVGSLKLPWKAKAFQNGAYVIFSHKESHEKYFNVHVADRSGAMLGSELRDLQGSPTV